MIVNQVSKTRTLMIPQIIKFLIHLLLCYKQVLFTKIWICTLLHPDALFYINPLWKEVSQFNCKAYQVYSKECGILRKKQQIIIIQVLKVLGAFPAMGGWFQAQKLSRKIITMLSGPNTKCLFWVKNVAILGVTDVS